MKINFSNLAKLFLAGVCFVAVGCTDYGQDIESLNNRITVLETKTIAPLAADLKTVQDDLKDAKKDLQDQIDIHEGLINGLTDDLATAKKDVKTNKDLIDGLTTDLTKVEGDLKTTNDKIDNAVKEINGNIATLDKSVADLKAKDEAFAKQIADLDVAVKNNTAKIEELTKGLADEVKAREELQKALNDHLAIYATFVKDVDAKFQALNLEVEALKAKDVELQGLIDALDVRLKANEALAEQNKKDIAQNAADIKANKELLDATIETLKLLQAAHAALETRVGNLETAFDEYQKAIRAELDAHYAAFTAYTEKTDKAIADLVAENQAQQIAIEANLAAINNIKDVEIPALQAAIKEQADALVAAKAELQGNIDALAKVVEDYKTEMATIISGLDGRITENANQIKLTQESVKALKSDLQAQIDKIDARVKTLEDKLAALEAKVQSLIDNEIKALQNGLDALRGRIQSLVFVPEYTDGKATIEWAKLGDAIVEGQSVLKYQVFPANCAASVTKEHLTFLFSEPLKTRAAEPALNVVGVKVVDEAKGIIAVTVNARNLADNFYQPDNNGATNYAVSLVLDDKANVNLASCYVNLIPAPVQVLNVKLSNAAPTNYTIEYTNTTDKVQVLPQHNYEFSINGKGAYTVEGMLAMGYEIVVTKGKITYALNDTQKPNVFKNEESETDYLKLATVSLKESKKEAVGLVETVTYSYDVNGTPLSAYATVEVTKVQGTIELESTIVWNYTEDANGTYDAGLESTCSVDLAAIVAQQLPKDHDYATVVKGTLKDGKATVSVDGKVDANVEASLAQGEPIITLKNFAWNKTYTIVAVYDLPSVTATVTATVTTVDRKRDPITLTLVDGSTNIVYETKYDIKNSLNNVADIKKLDVKNIESYKDVTTLYSLLKAMGHTTIVVDGKTEQMKDVDFLKDIFVNHAYKNVVDSFTAHTFTAGTISSSKTDDGIYVEMGAQGVDCTAHFTYEDITAMPKDLTHTYEITTWYGQKITIKKLVNFVRTTEYDFMHEDEWVFSESSYYFSNVLAWYNYVNDDVNALEFFDTQKVNMNTAFYIVDKAGKRVLPKENTYDYSEHHLAVHFDFAEGAKVKYSAFEGNLMDYADYNLATIGVYGGLYYTPLVKGGTDEVPLVTSFDKGGIYDDYLVKRYEFVSSFFAEKQSVVLDNAKVYEIPVEALVTLIDRRPTPLGVVNKSLLQYTLEGVTYTDRKQMASQLDSNPNFDISDVTAKWVLGDGSNGFKDGTAANQAYYGLQIVSKCTTEIPDGLKRQVSFLDNKFTVDATSQIELTAPKTFNISIDLMYRNTVYKTIETTITISPVVEQNN